MSENGGLDMSTYLDVAEVARLRKNLERDGWCVVRRVFSEEEVECAKKAVLNVDGELKLNGMTFGNSFAQISRIFHSNEHINHIIQEALQSEQLLYFGDAVLRTDNAARYKFHKDNILRASPSIEFDEPVPVVRCGWYLADHINLSGGIAFQTGSHLRAGSMGFGTAAASTPNDLVIWFTTTSHAANYQRIGFGNNVLPTSPPAHKLLSMLPGKWLQARVSSRVTYLPTFAKKGSYFNAFSEYIGDRRDYMQYVEAAKQYNNVFEEILDDDIWTIEYPKTSDSYGFEGHWENVTNELPKYVEKLKKTLL